MSTDAELNEALIIAMLDRAEQGGDGLEDDLETLAALADDPEALRELVGEESVEQPQREERAFHPDNRKTIHHKSLVGYLTKSKGSPCKQGEAASRTGCIPAEKEGSSSGTSAKPSTETEHQEQPAAAEPTAPTFDEETKSKLRELGMVGTFPPANARNIKVADLSSDPEALKQGVIVQWDQVTKSGRVSRQYRYTQEFHDHNANEKFERVTAIEPHLDKIKDSLVKQMQDEELPQRKREAAAIANTIRETGLRPTDGNESVKHGHFGISSLQKRHVKIKGDAVYLDFIGKEGVRNKAVIRDPENVAFLTAALEQSGKPRDFIFKEANSDDAGNVLKAVSKEVGGPEDIKVKDLRTVKATQLARQEVAKRKKLKLTGNVKKDALIVRKAIKEMSTRVANVLNNTPQQALANYIHPEVFKEWQAELDSQFKKEV